VAANGGGTVTTVDRYHFQSPTPEETVARAGLEGAVTFVRVDHSSYTWWLKEQVQARSDAAGNCEPAYDFVMLDGSHDWHIDGLAVLLAERLMRPGAWMALDDLDWSYERSGVERPPNLSADEIVTPHVREIFDVLLRPHPAFGEFRIENETWGWARKVPGAAACFSQPPRPAFPCLPTPRLRYANCFQGMGGHRPCSRRGRAASHAS
jgi:hypothetical protein